RHPDKSKMVEQMTATNAKGSFLSMALTTIRSVTAGNTERQLKINMLLLLEPRITDLRIRLAACIEFGGSSPAFHLRNIPENHPFLWDFKAFWNASFTKLGSL